jgi:xanthine dehydrogenase accessory factor
VFAVVATQGDDDERALRAALALEPAYLGVIASPTRAEHLREGLLAAGESRDAVARIRGPAGLDIGAGAPEEIALSVLAEIVQVRRSAGAERPVEAPEREAVDPVCGMTVAIRGARHTATFGGATFYFCCGGCRERFAADPAQYAVVGEAT